MAKINIHIRKMPILVFVVLLSSLVFIFSSVQADNGGQFDRSANNWTSNGYREVTVSLPVNSESAWSSQSSQLPTTSSAGCVLSETDMISHWPLDDGPGAKTFKDVFDGHDGTCVGASCPVTATGKVGGAFNFTNSDKDSIEIPSSTDFDWLNTDSFSVGVWVKTSQDCAGNKVFIGRHREILQEGSWWIGCAPDETDSDKGVAVFRLRDSNLNARQANGTTKINDGRWHYIIGVRNGSTDKNFLYVDGVLEKTMDVNDEVYTGNFASTRQITMGSYDQTLIYYYEGVLDESVIYDRALPANEIESYFNACIVLSPNIYLPVILR